MSEFQALGIGQGLGDPTRAGAPKETFHVVEDNNFDDGEVLDSREKADVAQA